MLRASRSEAPDAGIGTFAAASRTAGPRGDNRYSITLACTAPREATLVIDIHGVDRAGTITGHVAYAVKHMRLSPRRPLRVGICFRWGEEATFEVDGAREPADQLWVGDLVTAPFISVAATLRAVDGRCLDRTVIFQPLDGEPTREEQVCGAIHVNAPVRPGTHEPIA
jgi:hypothetical protein